MPLLTRIAMWKRATPVLPRASRSAKKSPQTLIILGAPGEIRTHDLCLRSLQRHFFHKSIQYVRKQISFRLRSAYLKQLYLTEFAKKNGLIKAKNSFAVVKFSLLPAT